MIVFNSFSLDLSFHWLGWFSSVVNVPFLSNWWRNQQLRSFCIVLVIIFGGGKIWLPISFDIGARSTLNLQYHCRTLMDIWEHALYWCETLILMERGIDTPSLRLLQDASTKYPIALVKVHWRQFRLVNFKSHLGISKALILVKKGVTRRSII